MARDRLTDTKVRQAKPGPKPYKLSDGAGLFLLVNPNGARYWRLKYRTAGKEKLFAVGVYPEVSLAEARDKVAQARRLLRDGGDPVAERRRQRTEITASADTFQAIAQEWLAARAGDWSPSYRETVHSALSANLYPQIGSYSIRSITVPILRESLLLMERRGALSALRKVRMWASQVFRYAVATGRADYDPAAPLRGTFKAHKPKNFAAVTKAQEFGELIARMRTYDGSFVTRSALMLIAYTFVRTSELREACWSEFDLDGAVWRIPAERMKMGEEHIVPLSRQVLAVLSELHLLSGHSHLVFPNERTFTKPMSENTILFALYRLGYHGRATGHGFRSSASTLLNEMGFDPDVVERQLAHQERNKVRAAYHRAQYIDDRRVMMQKWADYIDGLGAAPRARDAAA
ncbi:tyrosine-type recombinase/integrase [Methylobacterium durans]|uniref:Integrase n=1 Tax=Methylobacterium durans TaxID=2202825 RepID=A0A2U8W1Z2_9HYPH|nr:integrase arm-type DNA-binding domain-containing protein [Methylobacterium durans]AWN39520.1 integrase [Methylobacterium durans]